MAWNIIQDFADKDLFPKQVLEHVRQNLNYLKYRSIGETIADPNPASETTNSATLVSVANTRYQVDVETTGGDVLVYWAVETGSGDNSSTGIALTVDGVRLNNLASSSHDVERIARNSQGAVNGLCWIVSGLAAGTHTFAFEWREISGTVKTLYSAKRNFVFAVEI